MVRCSVLGCKSDSAKKTDVSFHSFPVYSKLRQRWIEATGRINWNPKKTSKVCSAHFNHNELIKKRKVTLLFPYAVPCTTKSCIPPPTSTFVSPIKEENVENEDNWSTEQEIKSCIQWTSSSIGSIKEEYVETDDDWNKEQEINSSKQQTCTSIVAVKEEFVEIENDWSIQQEIQSCTPSSTHDSSNEEDNMEMDNNLSTQQLNLGDYTPLQRKLKRVEQKSEERLRKLRALREKCRRLTKKVEHLENVIADLKAESRINN